MISTRDHLKSIWIFIKFKYYDYIQLSNTLRHKFLNKLQDKQQKKIYIPLMQTSDRLKLTSY